MGSVLTEERSRSVLGVRAELLAGLLKLGLSRPASSGSAEEVECALRAVIAFDLDFLGTLEARSETVWTIGSLSV